MKNFQIRNLLDPSVISLFAGILLETVGLIVYSQTGVNDFNEKLSTPVLVFAIVAVVFGAILLFLKAFVLDRLLRGSFEILPWVNYLFALLGLVYYIGSQVNYLANVLVSIDGNSISAAFVITLCMLLLSSVAFLVAGILVKKKVQPQEGGNENEAERI